MRLKLLPAIVSALFIIIAITACLDSDNNYVSSSDDTVKEFGIDKIYGVEYKFTIDQIQGLIYNQDSVPYSADTIINKILITSLSTYGYVTTGDTAIVLTDSFDLSNTMKDLGGEPFVFKVQSPDLLYSRFYRVEVRRHQQDPDSLVWRNPTDYFSNGAATGYQKTEIINDHLNTYLSYKTMFRSALSDGANWEATEVKGLSETANLSSLRSFRDKLYMADAEGNVSESADGINWQPAPITGNVVTLLAIFPNHMAGIVSDEGTRRFAITNPEFNGWEVYNAVPSDFPVENISATLFKTNTGVYKNFLTGKPLSEDDSKTSTWMSDEGKNWINSTSSAKPLPYMEQPTLMIYGGDIYAFGGEFDYLYKSLEGMHWTKVEEKVTFPEEFRGRKTYSTVVDENNYIWIIWSKGVAEYTETDDDDNETEISIPHEDEVWKGRINKLAVKE